MKMQQLNVFTVYLFLPFKMVNIAVAGKKVELNVVLIKNIMKSDTSLWHKQFQLLSFKRSEQFNISFLDNCNFLKIAGFHALILAQKGQKSFSEQSSVYKGKQKATLL